MEGDCKEHLSYFLSHFKWLGCNGVIEETLVIFVVPWFSEWYFSPWLVHLLSVCHEIWIEGIFGSFFVHNFCIIPPFDMKIEIKVHMLVSDFEEFFEYFKNELNIFNLPWLSVYLGNLGGIKSYFWSKNVNLKL